MIFLMLLTVSPQIAGSPGPLLRNNPSNSSGFRAWFQGTTSSLTPLFKKQRSWLYFRPQSTTHIRGNPLVLYTTGACKIIDKIYSDTHTYCHKALLYLIYMSMHYLLKAASCSATEAISQLQEVFTTTHYWCQQIQSTPSPPLLSLNIILPFTPRFYKFGFTKQNSVNISYSPTYILHSPSTSTTFILSPK